jgi:cold shock protein
MPNGVVKWFSREKGFGFIVPEGGDPTKKDIFIHHSGILMQGYRFLETGQRVTYKEREGDGGPMAFDVIATQDNGKKRVCPTCHQQIVPPPTEEEGK